MYFPRLKKSPGHLVIDTRDRASSSREDKVVGTLKGGGTQGPCQQGTTGRRLRAEAGCVGRDAGVQQNPEAKGCVYRRGTPEPALGKAS